MGLSCWLSEACESCDDLKSFIWSPVLPERNACCNMFGPFFGIEVLQTLLRQFAKISCESICCVEVGLPLVFILGFIREDLIDSMDIFGRNGSGLTQDLTPACWCGQFQTQGSSIPPFHPPGQETVDKGTDLGKILRGDAATWKVDMPPKNEQLKPKHHLIIQLLKRKTI